ncbi:sterol carrier protein domain-containing protein [Serinicoccus chungangensis]|uniref:sterol carrier protein domain-containing protein n=1 Tax=Serinicoccus chungangensis TaxID=767452 RepID=UPI00137AAE09|nr:sterol carrier protein domain-containing protein [Serinicoccus chungangensis]
MVADIAYSDVRTGKGPFDYSLYSEMEVEASAVDSEAAILAANLVGHRDSAQWGRLGAVGNSALDLLAFWTDPQSSTLGEVRMLKLVDGSGRMAGYAVVAPFVREAKRWSLLDMHCSPQHEFFLVRKIFEAFGAASLKSGPQALDSFAAGPQFEARLRPVQVLDGIYARIFDPVPCLLARSYAVEGQFVLELIDDLFPENSGRYAIEVREFEASVTETKAEPDVCLGIDWLTQLFLCDATWVQARNAGAIYENVVGACERLDRFFAVPHQPHQGMNI